MNGIDGIDLNLLRLFDAVHASGSVSRAAQALGITQPAASQGLVRLRVLLGDALFVRAPGGVAPTPRAERLAGPVRQALAQLAEALADADAFEPARSRRIFRLHLSDIGEARFLPELMAALARLAPGVRVEAQPWPHGQIAQALDEGRLDLAIGFLPTVAQTRHTPLLSDRYVLLLRAGHPFLAGRRGPPRPASLKQLSFAAVRSHTDTLRILAMLRLEDRLRLSVANFLSLPAIVGATDLAVLLPRTFAQGFIAASARQAPLTLVEPVLPLREFTVSQHWSARFEHDAGLRWLRAVMQERFSPVGRRPP